VAAPLLCDRRSAASRSCVVARGTRPRCCAIVLVGGDRRAAGAVRTRLSRRSRPEHSPEQA
jgi:hypothetical protein